MFAYLTISVSLNRSIPNASFSGFFSKMTAGFARLSLALPVKFEIKSTARGGGGLATDELEFNPLPLSVVAVTVVVVLDPLNDWLYFSIVFDALGSSTIVFLRDFDFVRVSEGNRVIRLGESGFVRTLPMIFSLLSLESLYTWSISSHGSGL